MTLSRLDRWTVFSVAATASLGVLLLGLGQQALSLSFVAICAVIAAAICSDYLRWFFLPGWAASSLAVVAVVHGFHSFLVAEPGRQLLVIADLLIYLQIILLFQHKNTRIYWQICLLSLLQVVVAAALNLHVAFGALLIVYLLLAISSAVLLFMREETEWHRVSSTSAAGLKPSDSGWWFAPDATAAQAGAHKEEVVLLPEQRKDINSTVGMPLLWLVVRFSLLTLSLTCLAFFLFPRFGKSGWETTKPTATRLVGYSKDVSLNEFGEIHESPEEVMRVYFTDEATGQPFTTNREPYFHGDALTHYHPVVGKWFPQVQLPEFRPLPAPPKGATGLVRQSIIMESAGPLFSVLPVYRANTSSSRLRFNPDRNQVVRAEPPGFGLRRTELGSYEVLTSAFRFGLPRPIIPLTQGRLRGRRSLTQFDASYFPELTRIAAKALSDAGVTPENRVAAARVLERHLRSSQYSYTLHLKEQPPRGVDPIEYFISHHREGHCEYFASALTLMCRSQGIPARLIVGYRGGEYNRVGRYYLVRQLHAHAWVEVFLEPDQVPDLAVMGEEPLTAGGWLRLDPTPGVSADPTPVSGRGLFGGLQQFQDFVELIWRDYVVGFNADRQRDVVYGPVRKSFSALFNGILFNADWWSTFRQTLWRHMGLDSWQAFRERWFNWRTPPFLAFVALVLYLIFRLTAWAWAGVAWLVRKLPRRRRSTWTRQKQLDFFRRWERLASRLNLRRAPSQTHRELARAATTQLARGHHSHQAIAQLTDPLVDAFYRVRFGNEQLSSTELAALEGHLQQLTKLLDHAV